VQVGIAGFFIVIGFSSAKPKPKSDSFQPKTRSVQIKVDPDEITEPSIAPSTPEESAPVTPPQKINSTPKKKTQLEFGSMATPSGRRSARIASKSAQKKKSYKNY
jgi:hypothetical protein